MILMERKLETSYTFKKDEAIYDDILVNNYFSAYLLRTFGNKLL